MKNNLCDDYEGLIRQQPKNEKDGWVSQGGGNGIKTNRPARRGIVGVITLSGPK